MKQIGTPSALNLVHNCKKIDLIVNKARQLAIAGRYNEAFTELDSAIKIDRTKITIWCASGDIHSSLGNYGQSISDYTTAINIISPIPTATGELYLRRAAVFQALGNMDGARSDCIMAATFGNATAQQIAVAEGWL